MGFRNRFKGAFDSSQKKDDDSKSQENIRNFKYLSNLLESGKKEVILDSDITLSDGEEEEYFNGIRLDADDVIIDGDGHSIDAAGKARIFKVAGENIQLKNITFMNGSSGEGGAIYVDNFARAEIMDCVFKDNSADKNGSALINLGEIDLKGVEFAQNNSIGGGTVYNEVVGKVALTGCSFTDNTSQHGSGAFINFGKARFDDVKLERNTSQEGGGGAVNNQKGGSIKMTDSSFTDNASRTGGGALINYGKVTLNSVNFAGNSSKEGSGGGLNNQGSGKVSVSDCFFKGNAAQVSGGAVINFGEISIDNVEFSRNTSNEGYGAALNNQQEGIIAMANCSIANNESQDDGGGIFNKGEVTLKNVDFTGNASRNEFGGGLNNQGSGKISIIDSSFTDNFSQRSGGAMINYGRVCLERVEFNENTSENGDGGAISNQTNAEISCIDCSFRGNGSLNDGGAIVNFGKITQENSEFAKNITRDRHGGAISNQENAEISCIGCSFTGNVAQYHGGAIMNLGKIASDESDFEKNTALHGGAIYNSTNGNLSFSKTRFIANASQKDGGAIDNNQNSSNLEVDECEFRANMSDEGGGAIVSWGDCIISNSQFNDNLSKTNGNDINCQEGSFKLSNVKFDGFKEKSIFSTDENLMTIEECEFMEQDYDKILSESDERNFKFLDALVHTGTGEIVLDSDIVLDDGEENRYGTGIELKGDDIVIDGNGHSIDAAGKARIFTADGNITLKNLTLKNGYSKEDYGGAIFHRSESSLTIENVKFISNTSEVEGGAIVNFGDVTIRNSHFEKSHSVDRGGAIFNNSNGSLAITQTVFIENTSKETGGAIACYGKVTIEETDFINNASEENGGAICNHNEAELVLNGCSFKGNVSQKDGGAINVQDSSSLKADDCRFNGNESDVDGGAITSWGNSIISNSQFNENSAKNDGNNLAAFGGNVELSNSTFDDVQKKSIHTNSDAVLNLKDCEFRQPSQDRIEDENPEHDFKHLAKLVDGSAKEVVLDCDITLGNGEEYIYEKGIEIGTDYLAIDGDGHTIDGRNLTRIFTVAAKNVTLKNLTLKNASGSHGSAVCCGELASLEIHSCTFADNSSSSSGGAIRNYGKTVVKESSFENNYSGKSGGAIFNEENGDLDVLQSKFIRNVANGEGGAIDNNGESSNLNVSECKFTENTSKSDGGALRNCGKSVISSSEFESNICPNKGNDINMQSGSLELSDVKFNRVMEKAIFSNDESSLKLEGCEFIESKDAEMAVDYESAERNFKYLDRLVNSGEINIVLDSDIMVDDEEAKSYRNGIRLEADGVVIDGDGHAIDAKSLARIFHVTGKNIILKNLTLKNGLNEAGAAIYSSESATLEIRDCVFTDNVAESNGGAIFNDGEISLEGTNFTKNSAKEDSGGAINNQDGEMSLKRCIFTDNSSEEDGGAIFNWGEIALEDVDFTGNASSNKGGAINNQFGGKATLSYCFFRGNSAEDGGAVYAVTDDDVELEGCTFKGNAPDDKHTLV